MRGSQEKEKIRVSQPLPPEAIFRQHLTGGTDDGPGHSYYLMIFWED